MSLTSKIKKQERADRLMNNIPWFRLKMGDIFRSMVMPIAILTFLSIVYGVLDSVQRNITIKNTTISNNITYAKLIFKKLIGFVPMITAISVATTFNSNRTLGAITMFIGWVCFIAIQSVFIKFNGTSYEFLGIKTLKNIIGTNSINRLEIPGLSHSIIYVNSNMIVGFLVGYINALILSKISKRIFSVINITFIALVIAIALSMTLGVLHSLTIVSLTKGLEQSKDIFANSKLYKNSLNSFLAVLITSAMYPMQLQGLTENLYSQITNPYYKIIFALFVLPLVVWVLFHNAKKGNKKFALLLYLITTIASIALGQYQPILLTIFFVSPLLFLLICALLPAFASWTITAYVNLANNMDLIKSGDLVNFIRNFISFIKKDAAYKKVLIILIVSVVEGIVSATIAHFYIKYTKVCVLGKANVVKKMFAYEYITENNYVVFAKYHNKDVGNPIRHQVADEMLNKASLLFEKENLDAANSLSNSAHKMGYTKEVLIKSEVKEFENIGGEEKYKICDQPDQLSNLNVNNLDNSPIEKLQSPSLNLNIPNSETNTFYSLSVMNEELEDISDFNEFSSTEQTFEQRNSIFMPQNFEYTTELTPDVDSSLNIQEASLPQPSEPIDANVQQLDSTTFNNQNLERTVFDISNQSLDLEMPNNLSSELEINLAEISPENTNDEIADQEVPANLINYNFDKTHFLDLSSVEEIKEQKFEGSTDESPRTLDKETNKEENPSQVVLSESTDNLNISKEFSYLSVDNLNNNHDNVIESENLLELVNSENSKKEFQELDSFDIEADEENNLANLSSGLSFDEEVNSEQLMFKSLTNEENLEIAKPKMFSFETKIKHFIILSPLLGEIISQTPTSIEVLSSSGKLIMPNDAVVEYISEDRDKYIINIYDVRMEVLINAPLEKSHKQRLHNKIYANQGKKLYKGDFFLDINKKYYSENDDQMILTFRILSGNYDVYAIRHMNEKLSKWDGLFEISLNKSFDTKSRTAHAVEEDIKEN